MIQNVLMAAVHPPLLAETVRKLSDLEPQSRAKLFGALALLTAGGLALIFICWALLRAGRRAVDREQPRQPDGSARRHPEDWAQRPIGSDPSEFQPPE